MTIIPLAAAANSAHQMEGEHQYPILRSSPLGSNPVVHL